MYKSNKGRPAGGILSVPSKDNPLTLSYRTDLPEML